MGVLGLVEIAQSGCTGAGRDTTEWVCGCVGAGRDTTECVCGGW